MKNSSKNHSCPHCRAKLMDRGRFCGFCGLILDQRQADNQVDPELMHRLFKCSMTISSILDLDLLLKKIGEAAETLTDSEASSILLLDEGGKNLHFRVATGDKKSRIKKQVVPLGKGLAGWVAQNQKPVIVNGVSKDPRFVKDFDKESDFVTHSVVAVPIMMGKELIGVCEAINKRARKPFTGADEAILNSLSSFAAVSILNARLAGNQKNFFTNIIEVLTSSIEATDGRYVGHPSRVAEIACGIGQVLGIRGKEYRDLYYGALLHDLGLVVLNHTEKRRQATPYVPEAQVERLHPVLGADLLKDVRDLSGVLPLIRHHHEHWDGSGYPEGLAGENIPLEARILCLAEYLEEVRLSGARGPDLVTMQIQVAKGGIGTRFDPKVVEAYLSLVPSPSTAQIR